MSLSPNASSAPVRVRAFGTLQRIDLLIGAALVVALVGSAIGVATYDDDRLGAFRVTWTTSSLELEGGAAQGSGATLAGAFPVASRNVTTMLVDVTVGGAPARVQPVAIHVSVDGPNGTHGEEEGALPAGPGGSVTIHVEVPVAPVPTRASVAAASPDAARRALDASSGSSSAIGAWNVTVSLAPSSPGPLGSEPFAASYVPSATVYAAEVALDTPEVTRG
ncbi:MAG TPA: hypothetical protein VM370_12365 [Candidatus Thermoplasmatota archaeon]|nr:hypothetical protein [Candidatus Thermoplasmatota archaeon]